MTPNIVAATSGLSSFESAARCCTIPAKAAAAFNKIFRLIRLIPAMSTTEFSMRMSLSPTHCRTSPEASVLTMTLGTPIGNARIAAVPIVVPADPPSAITPSISPRSKAAKTIAVAPAAACVTAAPRSFFASISSGDEPAAANTVSRVTSPGNVGVPMQPVSTTTTSTPSSVRRSRTNAASWPFVSKVASK